MNIIYTNDMNRFEMKKKKHVDFIFISNIVITKYVLVKPRKLFDRHILFFLFLMTRFVM